MDHFAIAAGDAQHGTSARRYDTQLSDLLNEAVYQSATDGSLFIDSGLRAARATPAEGRRRILCDLASVLGCAAQDLDFLFHAQNFAATDADPIIMPDYAAALRGPHYAEEQLAAE